MRKKYLSALLFGALLFASAGTFTSCKDYDDDINNLQGQIDDVNTAITELQNTVKGGKYVTAVSNTGNTITFTFSDGSTTQVALEDKVGSVVTVEGGVLYIDGEATEIKVAESTPGEPGEEHKDQIIIENNMWSVLQEDGTYKTTNIPVSGVSVSGSEAEGFTFRVYASDGTYQDVELPTATSSITDLILYADANATTPINTINNGGKVIEYATYTFEKYPTNKDISKWEGPRALPARGTKIVSGNSQVSLQVNPTNVDGTVVEFKLVDSKNNYPSNLTLKAEEDTRLLTTTRGANGLYLLSLEDKTFATETASKAYTNQFATDTEGNNLKLYAVAAGEARSEYGVTLKSSLPKVLKTLNVYKNNSTKVAGYSIEGAELELNNLDINTWYYIQPEEIGAFYDMFVTKVSNDDAVLYGLEFKNEEGNYAFRATKTPDNVSKESFGIKITTVDKNGNRKDTKIKVSLSEKITEGLTYDAVSYQLSSNNVDKNYFSIDLNDMKEYLGTEGLALWNTKVGDMVVTFKNATTGATVVTSDAGTTVIAGGITVTPVKEVKDGIDESVVSSLKDAKFLKFAIDNAVASEPFVIGQKYNAVISFRHKYDTNAQLNSITIPFTLTLPEITSLFQLDQKLVENDAAICYLYAEDYKNVETTGAASFMLSRVFQKIESTGFQVALDDQTKVGDTDKTAADLAEMAMVKDDDAAKGKKVDFKHNDEGETYITLTGDRADGTGLNAGYGEELTLHVTGKYAGYWAYPTGQDTFTFKVKVMSPIYEGKVTPKEGNVVTIPATELNGYKFGNDDITGYTYNSAISYNVLPDKFVSGGVDWTRTEIADVTAESSNTRIFKIGDNGIGGQLFPATQVTSDDKKVTVGGYFKLEAQQVPSTVTDESINVTVTDIWGYSKTSTIPVQITVD